jgi:hypothetical protein
MAWSTFGPHAIGTERYPAVSSGASWCRSQVGSCGYEAGRALIGMRSQVQVLAGPPAKITGESVAVFEPVALPVLHLTGRGSWSRDC